MPWFDSTHEETRTLKSSADAAAAHFADPEAIVANTKGVESSSIDGDVVHLVLEEEDHGVLKFQSDYKFRVQRDGNTVRWEAVEGNVDQSGKAVFTTAGDGCELTYEETLKLDLEVNAMMAPMLKPVIRALMANEMKDYVKRMVAGLED